jgi:hypothetical protein
MHAFRRAAVLILAALLFPALLFAQEPSLSRSHYEAEPGLSVMTLTLSAGGQAVYGIIIEVPGGGVEDLAVPDGWSGVASDDHILFHSFEKPIASGRSLSFKVLTRKPESALKWHIQDRKGRITPTRSL